MPINLNSFKHSSSTFAPQIGVHGQGSKLLRVLTFSIEENLVICEEKPIW